MKDGFVKTAAGTPDIKVADCGYNCARIKALIDKAHEQGVRVLVLPELCITGYTCQDLFFQQTLLDGALNALKEGVLPLRVTHNDTKLNNILIDRESHEGICVIDLDTTMPGLSINDFGDSIRFGANHSAEDIEVLCDTVCEMDLGVLERIK